MSFVQREESEIKHRLLFVASPFIVLSAWELFARVGVIDGRFFPPPTAIIKEVFELLIEGGLGWDILSSLRRIMLGTILGFVPGVLLGIIMGLWPFGRAFFSPLVALTYPIPKIAILPLLLIVFGLGELSNIMVVTIGVFFLGVINTYAGVRQISRTHFEVAKVYGISRWSTFLKIVLPASFPDIFTGLKLGIGYGLILIVAAEMMAAGSGLGFRIWKSWETFAIRELYGCLALISFLGVVFAVLLEKLEEKAIPWKSK